MHLIGVISDTHGYVPDGVRDAFVGVSHILHAGDIDSGAVLGFLRAIAPVTAVRGNMDNLGDVRALARSETIPVGDVLVHIKHSIDYLDIDPVKAGVSAVVFGHTHRPCVKTHAGVLFLNPGSASKPRGGHKPSVALLRVDGRALRAEVVNLE
jgi:putative phosphoesterase